LKKKKIIFFNYKLARLIIKLIPLEYILAAVTKLASKMDECIINFDESASKTACIPNIILFVEPLYSLPTVYILTDLCDLTSFISLTMPALS